MVGVEFDAPLKSGVASKVTAACLQRRMLLLPTSLYETVRFIPPLTVTSAEIAKALSIFESALDEVFP